MSVNEAYPVSVIIPCYNHAHFVSEAIESALGQTRAPLEVIVVDDGSTDATPQVAARYPGVRYVRQENQGLSAARNTGLRESRGDYLVFLDADDRLLPHALETGVECFGRDSHYAFVYGKCHLIDGRGAPLPTPPMTFIEPDDYLELLRGNCIWMTGVAMFRRAVVESVGGFNTAESPTADYDIYLRISRQFPVKRHGSLIAEYRQHGANMSHNPVLMLRSILHVIRSQRKFVRGDRARARAYRAGVRHWQEFYGDQLVIRLRRNVHTGKWRAAARDALMLLRYSPRVWARHACRKLYCLLFRRRSDFDGPLPETQVNSSSEARRV